MNRLLLYILILSCAAHGTPVNFTHVLEYWFECGYMMPDIPSEVYIREDTVDMSVTTVLDNPVKSGGIEKETQTVLPEPRVPMDLHNLKKRSKRKKRYVITNKKWDLKEITYNINTYPKDLNSAAVDEVFQQAFYMWSNVTDLEFKHVNYKAAQINISFIQGEHGDSIPFTEASYSHAFAPTSGEIHFDRNIPWTIRDTTGIDLLQVAVYEIGHALGLSDSDVEDSVMRPYVKPIFKPNFALYEDDIKGIQAIYGKRPDLCSNSSFDAIFEYCDGMIYVFRGEYFWKLAPDGIASGYPERISSQWPDVPSNLDAATATDSGLIYFFKGNRYWKYTNRNPIRCNYSMSHGWPGVPNDVDAVTWKGNSMYYFFKGSKYWEYNILHSCTHGPKNLTDWGGIQEHNIQEALYVQSGYIYFFTNGLYSRYNIETNKIDNAQPKYPRPIGPWWFHCSTVTGPTDRTTTESTTTESTTTESTTTESTTTESTTTESTTTESTTTESTTTESTTTESTTTESTTTESTTTESTTTESTTTESTTTESTTTESTTTESTTTESTTTESTTTESTTIESTTTDITTIEMTDEIITTSALYENETDYSSYETTDLEDAEEPVNTVSIEPAGMELYEDENEILSSGRIIPQDDLYISGEVQEVVDREWTNEGTYISGQSQRDEEVAYTPLPEYPNPSPALLSNP